jgi:DNA-binding MarR family transcriptional regulator
MLELIKEPAMKNTNLIITIGIIEGEILTYLENSGKATMAELTRDLEWPSSFLWMALGALVKGGLVLTEKHELDMVIYPAKKQETETPHAWG